MKWEPSGGGEWDSRNVKCVVGPGASVRVEVAVWGKAETAVSCLRLLVWEAGEVVGDVIH